MQKSGLFEKYDVAGPRYTSYPPVPFWRDMPTPEVWLKNISEDSALSERERVGVGVYVHIPFCESLCFYCGCNNFITHDRDKSTEYVSVVLKELEMYRSQAFRRQPLSIQCLHLGGGTPTYLKPEDLDRLVSTILSNFKMTPDFEFSVEVDPRRTTIDHLKVLRSRGCNRLSLGVQDFAETVQKKINRVQPFNDVRAFVEAARGVGFVEINFDLIYGLPLQTEETVRDTFEKVVSLRPGRIAFYSYAHVPSMRPAQAKLEADLPSSSEKRKLFELGRALLLDAGYVEIGMDHFALPTDTLAKSADQKSLHRNFMGYTNQKNIPLIGLGVSAISESREFYMQNEKDLAKYMQVVSAGHLPLMRGHQISRADHEIKDIILGLLTKYEHTFVGDLQLKIFDESDRQIKDLVSDGLITCDKKSVVVTTLGRAFIRNICMVFDPKLKESQATQFSKTV